jgi:hypothetical protein
MECGTVLRIRPICNKALHGCKINLFMKHMFMLCSLSDKREEFNFEKCL